MPDTPHQIRYIIRFALFVAIKLVQPAGSRFAHWGTGVDGRAEPPLSTIRSLEQMQLALDSGELLTEEFFLLFRQTFVDGGIFLDTSDMDAFLRKISMARFREESVSDL